MFEKGVSSTTGTLLLIAVVIILFGVSSFFLYGEVVDNKVNDVSSTEVSFTVEGDRLIVSPESYDSPVVVRVNGNVKGNIRGPADVVSLTLGSGSNSVEVLDASSDALLQKNNVRPSPVSTTSYDNLLNTPHRVVGSEESLEVQTSGLSYDSIDWNLPSEVTKVSSSSDNTRIRVRYTSASSSITIEAILEDSSGSEVSSQSFTTSVDSNPNSGGGGSGEYSYVTETVTLKSSDYTQNSYVSHVILPNACGGGSGCPADVYFDGRNTVMFNNEFEDDSYFKTENIFPDHILGSFYIPKNKTRSGYGRGFIEIVVTGSVYSPGGYHPKTNSDGKFDRITYQIGGELTGVESGENGINVCKEFDPCHQYINDYLRNNPDEFTDFDVKVEGMVKNNP